ncbi:FAD-dependent monooxygenase [Streptomyces sp. NPDC059080]|uniref:FAD-dependent monooxygenase n=1 Tax=Streptomyces sp. NPDC059080 TaxID=3346718 RepID=UPI0036A19469
MTVVRNEGAAGRGGPGPAVLISGASVAGPALAYWLAHHGFRPTVVEVAPALRDGGFAVDFRGEVHRAVLERMGLLDEVRAHATGGHPLAFTDPQGAPLATVPAAFAGGGLEILRSRLSRLLHDRSLHADAPPVRPVCPPGGGADATAPGSCRPAATEYLFGDSLTSLTETPDGVRVTFERAAPRHVDLVVGADGVHSTVRRLAFGPEERFVRHLGHHIAAWDLPPGTPPGLTAHPGAYSEPGRTVSVGRLPHRAAETAYAGEAFCVFAGPRLPHDRRDPRAQIRLIAAAYEGCKGRAVDVLATLPYATGIYFDAISRVDVPTWSTGRTVLLGDAAHGATLGGMGTGAALVGAYVLAGELSAARGDHRLAFARYEQRMRPYATRCQEGGRQVGEFLAPRTQQAIDARHALLNTPEACAAMLDEGWEVSEGIALPDYSAGLPEACPMTRLARIRK